MPRDEHGVNPFPDFHAYSMFRRCGIPAGIIRHFCGWVWAICPAKTARARGALMGFSARPVAAAHPSPSPRDASAARPSRRRHPRDAARARPARPACGTVPSRRSYQTAHAPCPGPGPGLRSAPQFEETSFGYENPRKRSDPDRTRLREMRRAELQDQPVEEARCEADRGAEALPDLRGSYPAPGVQVAARRRLRESEGD